MSANQSAEATVSVPLDVEFSRAVPVSVEGLDVYPFADQTIDGHRVQPESLGIVINGVEEYLSRRGTSVRDIPSSYSRWSDELPDATCGARNIPVVEGPVGVNREGGDPVRICYSSELIRVGVRVLNGKGRFSPTEYSLHLGIPFAVLRREGCRDLAIGPMYRSLDEHPDEPAFTHSRRQDAELTRFDVCDE